MAAYALIWRRHPTQYWFPKEFAMRNFVVVLALVAVMPLSAQINAANCCTLTIVVEGMDSAVGNLGVLVFNNNTGWPENRTAALEDIVVPAEKGTQTVKGSEPAAG
jgi:uncharacterized protein (DUF2141 family)